MVLRVASYLYQMSATFEAISGLAAWAEDAALEHQELPPAAVNILQVCLAELVTNVAMHGMREDRAPTVKVGLEIEDARIAVLIEDDGRPFDPLKGALRAIEKNLATATAGGRGVRIVRHMTRAMSYMRAGDWNRVQLEIA